MTAKTCTFQLTPESFRVIKSTLARSADKWSMTVIVSLQEGALRFNELRRRTGATQKMLTLTLRSLERDGYLVRTEKPGNVPEVHYTLTDLGRDALRPVLALAEWAILRTDEIEAARHAYDLRAEDTRL